MTRLPRAFEWDQQKSKQCLRERGFDFAYCTRLFLDRKRIETIDRRFDYGEIRIIVIGKIDRYVFVLIYTKRRNSYRIISARRANQKEIRRYNNENSSRKG